MSNRVQNRVSELVPEINAINMQYKQKRQQRKHDLVNRYKSLSLMAGDDFTKLLSQTKKINFNQQADDFDDISSIYTNQQKNNELENTLRRIRIREMALSNADDQEDLYFINQQLNKFHLDEGIEENKNESYDQT